MAGGTEAPLGHLWSLAVEEQFYLLWPVLLVGLLALSARWRFVAVGGLIAVSALLPWLYWDGGAGAQRIYFGTDTRAVGLLMGAFSALVWHRRHALGRATRFAALRAWLGLAFVLWVAQTARNSSLKFLLLLTLLGLAVAQVVPYLAENRGAAVAGVLVAAAGVAGQAVVRALPLALRVGDLDQPAAVLDRAGDWGCSGRWSAPRCPGTPSSGRPCGSGSAGRSGRLGRGARPLAA